MDTIYSLKLASRAEWDAFLETLRPEDPETGEPVAWTEAEQRAAALNAGAVVMDAGTDDVLYTCLCLDTERRDALPGVVVSEGRGRERYVNLPTPLKLRAYRARIYRHPTADLRAECNAAVAAILEARVPASGTRSAKPADPEGALLVLEEAQRRAADEDDPTTEALVRMDEVTDSDVVEEDAIMPVVAAGEKAE